MSEFTFRHTTMDDYETILAIYARARAFMKENGNPTQWRDNWPPADLVREDIQNGDNYVCLCNGEIVGVFAYFQGVDVDPTYLVIDDGAWIKDGEYGVVHRLASLGTVKGVGAACLNYCYEKCHHLRVDTHADNKVIQNLLASLGFVRTGTIYVEKDGTARWAYEKAD